MTLLREQLDTNIRLPGDVERYLDVPFLGYLGRLDKRRGNDLIALTDPKSAHSEALKTIRTNILYSPGGRSAQVLAITSPNPEEGKTLMAANLAISMAQAGRRVLLVDADMRKPRLHRVFRIKNKAGLRDILEGRMTLGNATQSGGHPNLTILTSGPIAQNPSELLGSAAMSQFIAELRKRFDRVLFDMSPVMAVTDPLVLAGMVDGIMLVAKSGWTSSYVLQSVVERLRALNPEAAFQEVSSPGETIGSGGPRILGVIINQVTFKRRPYYYQGYYYDYRYRYGQPTEKGKEPALVKALPAPAPLEPPPLETEETREVPPMPQEERVLSESEPPKDLDTWVLSSQPEEAPVKEQVGEPVGKGAGDLDTWVFSSRQEFPIQDQAGGETTLPVWETSERRPAAPEEREELEDWVLTPRATSRTPLHEAKESWTDPSRVQRPKARKPDQKASVKEWEKLLLLDRDDEEGEKK